MQHYVSQRLKKYLLLIRLPNVFTTPSNILAGYFAAAFTVAEVDGAHLISLMISSGLLYIAGIVLNDYFDIEIDKRERPSRPLPSGKISKGHALAIAIVALLIANTIALVLGPTSLAVSLVITLAIIAYDYQLKHGVVGPFAMGATRFLNVIFGASPVLLLYINNHSLAIVGTAAASLFLYVSSITILSKKEAENERPNSAIVFFMVFGVILAIAGLGLLLLQLRWTFLLNLSLFAAVMIVTFKRYLVKDSPSRSVQKAVRNMFISIIILDSVFVTGTAGLAYGIAALLLIAPAIVLARKLYVT